MKTLLLVEDDARISLALGIRLGKSGYSIVTAPDAVHAMKQAVTHAPAAIVLDINLPGGDGFLVAERLRANPATASIPVIFITASKVPGLAERAAEVGAVALIAKPFTAVELIEVIERALDPDADDELALAS